jgi:hypothetical protein
MSNQYAHARSADDELENGDLFEILGVKEQPASRR